MGSEVVVLGVLLDTVESCFAVDELESTCLMNLEFESSCDPILAAPSVVPAISASALAGMGLSPSHSVRVSSSGLRLTGPAILRSKGPLTSSGFSYSSDDA